MQSSQLVASPPPKRPLDPQDDKDGHHRKQRILSTVPTTVLSLPLNVWLIILKHLPLRHVLTLSCVSRDFLAHIFNLPEFWIHVQSEGKLQLSSKRFKNASVALRGLGCRQLVMNSLATMCDQCYSGYSLSAEFDGHKAVLPVLVDNNNNKYKLYLCGNCRIRYLQLHPEPVYADTRAITLSREAIASNYCLQRKDISYLLKKDNDLPRDSDAYIRLYARCIYGGDVGIEAEKRRENYIANVDL